MLKSWQTGGVKDWDIELSERLLALGKSVAVDTSCVAEHRYQR